MKEAYKHRQDSTIRLCGLTLKKKLASILLLAFFYFAVGSEIEITRAGFIQQKGGVYMTEFKVIDGKMHQLIFCRSINRNGKRIYPKKGKSFAFWVPVDEN